MNSNTVSVLLGNGNGTFQAQQTFATGSGTHMSVAVGDVNGDGKPDLVVANLGSNTVSVLLGNGNGTFQAQQTFATGSSPSSVAIGDVNGDGNPDLVVADANGAMPVSVLLGNGNGTFQAAANLCRWLYEPWSVAVGDVNGDGRPDIVAANFLSGTVSVLLNSANGNFTGQVYTLNTIAPLRRSRSTAPTRPSPVTNASTVSFTVTFSEAVTGVVANDFQLALGGTAAGTLSQVTQVSASVYTVMVSGITGSGTLGLNLVDNDSIHDAGRQSAYSAERPGRVRVSETIRHRYRTVRGSNGRLERRRYTRPGRGQI